MHPRKFVPAVLLAAALGSSLIAAPASTPATNPASTANPTEQQELSSEEKAVLDTAVTKGIKALASAAADMAKSNPGRAAAIAAYAAILRPKHVNYIIGAVIKAVPNRAQEVLVAVTTQLPQLKISQRLLKLISKTDVDLISQSRLVSI